MSPRPASLADARRQRAHAAWLRVCKAFPRLYADCDPDGDLPALALVAAVWRRDMDGKVKGRLRHAYCSHAAGWWTAESRDRGTAVFVRLLPDLERALRRERRGWARSLRAKAKPRARVAPLGKV